MFCACKPKEKALPSPNEPVSRIDSSSIDQVESITKLVSRDILLNDYFVWLDSLVNELNLQLTYEIDEYTLVHNNLWIVDSLAHTDYYYLKDKGILIDDPKQERIIEKGQMITIPNEEQVLRIKSDLSEIILDLNIPEYTLRIMQKDVLIHKFTTRVGKNTSRYLAMAGHDVNLRTKVGKGTIVRINKNPDFINPTNNRRYAVTRRDDDRITGLPNIPWLEPELDGIRYGQLIHPTTNLNTLGKPASNGCVGLRESDSWIIYYYAPIGTKVNFRYDLEVLNENNEIEILPDIYDRYSMAFIPFPKFGIGPIATSTEIQYISVCNCGAQ
jgi:L,D-transpeptidase ErfK/SrfK